VPTIFIQGYKFRFYSSDIYEPPHIHVIRDNNVAKIWLESVIVEYNHGYNRATLNHIVALTKENQAQLLEAWHGHFNQ
jgi:hypothetical protein